MKCLWVLDSWLEITSFEHTTLGSEFFFSFLIVCNFPKNNHTWSIIKVTDTKNTSAMTMNDTQNGTVKARDKPTGKNMVVNSENSPKPKTMSHCLSSLFNWINRAPPNHMYVWQPNEGVCYPVWAMPRWAACMYDCVCVCAEPSSPK